MSIVGETALILHGHMDVTLMHICAKPQPATTVTSCYCHICVKKSDAHYI